MFLTDDLRGSRREASRAAALRMIEPRADRPRPADVVQNTWEGDAEHPMLSGPSLRRDSF
jgi:hypothetical protein